jgi:hypothetical protein
MIASRVRATGELVPARWLHVGLVAGLLVRWVLVRRAEAR